MGKSSRSCSSDSGKSCNRGHWRPAEDKKLRQLVAQYGPQNWNFIAEHLEGRSGKSCRLRWYNQLDPNINKKPFTEEEEERLLSLHEVDGNKWAKIANFFPGRTDNAVKNHFHVIMARRKRERFTILFGKHHDHSNRINNPNLVFHNLQNLGKDHKGILGMSCFSKSLSSPNFSWSTRTSSTPTSSSCAVLPKQKSYSSTLGSYNSFTAPGIPCIGKVIPLIPSKFPNSSCMISTESSKTAGRVHEPDDNNYLGSLLRLRVGNSDHQKQQEHGFIDFLGVGSS